MAAPSFRALSRLCCSSARTFSPPRPLFPWGPFTCIPKPGATMVFDASAESSATASIHSKVQDKKLPEWFLYEHVWCGPRWWMAFEFAEIRKKYPKIPVEKVDIRTFLEEGERTRIRFGMSINVYSVIVKADFKGQEVMKRTILVMGRDVKELEAAVERLNKFRLIKFGSLVTRLEVWNRQQK